jgi:sugar phosphate isomerase/epimerase
MQVAIQTISWGPRPNDLTGLLREIREAGYTGIEFYQHPADLELPESLYRKLNGLGLRCIGIAGGSLQEKVDFVRGYTRAEQVSLAQNIVAKGLKGRPPITTERTTPYIYLDSWEGKAAEDALRIGMKLALHPHMFKQMQTLADVENLLENHTDLRFLPDTAHLTVAGEDIVKAIDHYYDRIDAIHLKDWRAEYGRAYQFYARGFAELGKGDVALEDVIGLLFRRGYKKWVVVEQDVSRDPLRSAVASRDWLRRRGI